MNPERNEVCQLQQTAALAKCVTETLNPRSLCSISQTKFAMLTPLRGCERHCTSWPAAHVPSSSCALAGIRTSALQVWPALGGRPCAAMAA